MVGNFQFLQREWERGLDLVPVPVDDGRVATWREWQQPAIWHEMNKNICPVISSEKNGSSITDSVIAAAYKKYPQLAGNLFEKTGALQLN